MKINPYLNFDGNCREAFDFYKSVFGGEFDAVNTFAEMPESPEFKIPEEEKDKIMHISLPVGDGHYLMGSDNPKSSGIEFVAGNNNHISIHPDSIEEGQRLYDALSKEGKVEMPFEKQFWGDHYGSFIDKFGVGWMINYHEGK